MGDSTTHPILSMLLTHTTSGPPVEKQATDLKIWLWAPSLKSDYFNSLTLWNVDELSWSWIPQKNIQLEKEKENFVVPENRYLRVVSSSNGKEVYKKAWCTCKVVVNFARASRASVTARLLRVNIDFQCFRRCRRVLRLFPLLEDGDNHMSLE